MSHDPHQTSLLPPEYPPVFFTPHETPREQIRRETATKFAQSLLVHDDDKLTTGRITKLAIEQTDHLLDELDRTNRMARAEAELDAKVEPRRGAR